MTANGMTDYHSLSSSTQAGTMLSFAVRCGPVLIYTFIHHEGRYKEKK